MSTISPARREDPSQEAELVDRAALTLCLSQRQVNNLQARYPKNLPLSAIFHSESEKVILILRLIVSRRGKQSATLEILLIEWTGGLLARWHGRCPTSPSSFWVTRKGFGGGGSRPNWKQERAAALALPNVRNFRPGATGGSARALLGL